MKYLKQIPSSALMTLGKIYVPHLPLITPTSWITAFFSLSHSHKTLRTFAMRDNYTSSPNDAEFFNLLHSLHSLHRAVFLKEEV